MTGENDIKSSSTSNYDLSQWFPNKMQRHTDQVCFGILWHIIIHIHNYTHIFNLIYYIVSALSFFKILKNILKYK